MTAHLTSRLLSGLALAGALLAAPAVSHAALDDPNTVVTVMQFTAKDTAAIPELKKRMTAMRDFQRKQSGYLENALFENRNEGKSPQYVGVARWKNLKDWEALWQSDQFQKLVRSINEVGTVNPGTFSVVK